MPLRTRSQNNPRLRSGPGPPSSERADRSKSPSHRSCRRSTFLSEAGVISKTLAPGTPGPVGLILPGDLGTRSYTETELGLQWMCTTSVAPVAAIASPSHASASPNFSSFAQRQTIEFDVAFAYMDVLLARASRLVQDDASAAGPSDPGRHDGPPRRRRRTEGRRPAREVQLSESREALVLAREAAFTSVSRAQQRDGTQCGLATRSIRPGC